MGETGVRNHALYEALREAGMTYEQLAAAVRIVAAESGDSLRTSKSTVSQWLAGSKAPAPRTVAYIAEALSRRLGRQLQPDDLGYGTHEDRPQEALGTHLGPDPVDMLRRLGDADIQRRTLLANAAYSVAAAALPLGVQQAQEYQ